VFTAELTERLRAPRNGAWCFGLIDMRAQGEVLSALRTDTPTRAFDRSPMGRTVRGLGSGECTE
jgi:hypothetical protein